MLKISFKKIDGNEVICEREKKTLTFKKEETLDFQEVYSIVNARNEKIGSIKRSKYNFAIFRLPKIDININNKEIMIKKNIVEFKDSYEIKSDDFSIVGDWEGSNFSICKDNKVLASVNIEKEGIEKNYIIDIIDKFSEEYILTILFSVDLVVYIDENVRLKDVG